MRYPRYGRSMGNTVERQIEAVAWMERSLENSISTVYIDDNKITFFKKLKRFMIYAISLEWIRGKKIEPFTNLF